MTSYALYEAGDGDDHWRLWSKRQEKREHQKDRCRSSLDGTCKKRRQALGLTQSQLAEMLGVEMETVSRYERGIVAPSFPLLEKVCDTLQIQAWALFSDGTEVPNAEGGIGELLQSLHSRDREFVVSFVKSYVEHHNRKSVAGLLPNKWSSS